jgi:bacterioferritin (cytochrome b1)
MKITEDMISEDEKRWHARDIITELGYCGNYMRDRKDMRNIDIRFYAYIMRKAYTMLKDQERRIDDLEEKLRLLEYGDQDALQSAMMPAT